VTCAESFGETNNSRYEKSNDTWFGVFCSCLDAGLLCQRTRGDYYHNAPDDRHNAGGTTLANNYYNDAPHGWRLLIDGNRQPEVALAGPVATALWAVLSDM
jgi:hypothetical protein